MVVVVAVVAPVGQEVARRAVGQGHLDGIDLVGVGVGGPADHGVPRRRARGDPERETGLGQRRHVGGEAPGDVDVDPELVQDGREGRRDVGRGVCRARRLVVAALLPGGLAGRLDPPRVVARLLLAHLAVKANLAMPRP